jgi:hypothetical protein
VNKYGTKHFGEVELSIEEDGSWADFDTMYNGQEITVSFSDYSIYGDKIKICWGIIDKYVEINEIAKKAIIENFPRKNGIVNYYFKCHFEDMLEDEELLEIFDVKSFKKLDIEKTVEKMGYPDLIFAIKDGEITFSADYMVSKEYSDEILLVTMDKELNVIGFSHES